WPKHLYVNANGKFGWHANTWETRILEAEIINPSVIAWLRNIPRKDWALCIPYRMGDQDKGLYPDLLIFRSGDNGITVDILDPHEENLADASYKARGLAAYAEKHGDQFGRIEILRVDNQGHIHRLDVNQPNIRARVLAIADNPDLDRLFAELA
ncbi:MAG: type III deoxyribonuclease, partial [Anaerolineae bacterium]